MADFAAPSGPPPPKVPEGWVARWNDQYKEWFYVNTITKQSQWDKPTEPARPPVDESGPSGPPPGYTPGDQPAPTDAKVNPYEDKTSTPSAGAAGASTQKESDEELARRLQAEEDARARSANPYGAANGYANTPPPQTYPSQLPPRSNDALNKGKGLLGKLLGGSKKPGGSSGGGLGGLGGLLGGGSHGGQHGGHHGGYGQPAYGQQPPYGQPQHGYGGYPGGAPGGYGGYPPQQHGYGGYPPQQHGYGGYPQQPMYGGYGQAHGKPHKSGPGMGAMAGGAALGVGAGLVGGALVADAIQDNQQEAYQDGFDAGQMDDGGGGDFDF